MTSRLQRPCSVPGCPKAAARDGRCVDHAKTLRREQDQGKQKTAELGYGGDWQKARRMYLRRNPLCLNCLSKGKTTAATVVDHIIPHRGNKTLFWDQGNWQSLCAPCHNAKTFRETIGRSWGDQMPSVTVVCGPPGSGKTTWVRGRARSGDLILDLDTIWQALTGLPMYDRPDPLTSFVLAARDTIMRRLLNPSDVLHAWVIKGAPKAREREEFAQGYNAEIVVLAVPVSECMRRIALDERRVADRWLSIVEGWWSQYEAREGDVVIT